MHILGNCQVDGTVPARHISGDIAKIYVLKEHSVYISPQEFPLRVLTIFPEGHYERQGVLYFSGVHNLPKAR